MINDNILKVIAENQDEILKQIAQGVDKSKSLLDKLKDYLHDDCFENQRQLKLAYKAWFKSIHEKK